MIRYRIWRYQRNITSGAESKVCFIQTLEILVPLSGEYTRTANAIKRKMKSPKPGEQINKFEWFCFHYLTEF